MLDNFSALDLFSMEGARSPSRIRDKTRRGVRKQLAQGLVKKLVVVPRKRRGGAGHRKLSGFIPLIGRKLHLSPRRRTLQGWGVPLSWPKRDTRNVDSWPDDSSSV